MRKPILISVALHGAAAAAVVALPLAMATPEPATAIQVELVMLPQPDPTPEPKPEPEPRALPAAPSRPASVNPPAPKPGRAAPVPAAAAIPAQEPAPAAAAAHAEPAPGGSGQVADTYVPPDGHAAYLSNPKPPYPSLARKRGWQGVVRLMVRVDEAGRAQSVRVVESSGYAVLDSCAEATVREWRFVPARRGGTAVAASIEIPIRFGLTEEGVG